MIQIHYHDYDFNSIMRTYIGGLKFPGVLKRAEITHDARTGHGVVKCYVEGPEEVPDSVVPLMGELQLAREAAEKLATSLSIPFDASTGVGELIDAINRHLS